ncbi:hypothetical protein BDW22DRAFT_1348267 [Trametopsis cervina]|nr:hypothetical protein BDW22DRAFT_1348267 [Trametopsis cervina]
MTGPDHLSGRTAVLWVPLSSYRVQDGLGVSHPRCIVLSREWTRCTDRPDKQIHPAFYHHNTGDRSPGPSAMPSRAGRATRVFHPCYINRPAVEHRKHRKFKFQPASFIFNSTTMQSTSAPNSRRTGRRRKMKRVHNTPVNTGLTRPQPLNLPTLQQTAVLESPLSHHFAQEGQDVHTEGGLRCVSCCTNRRPLLRHSTDWQKGPEGPAALRLLLDREHRLAGPARKRKRVFD